jgi:hypothetical protein
MCHEDLTVIRGRIRGRLAALVAVVAVAPGIAACGGGDELEEITVPAETGAAQTDPATEPADGTGSTGEAPAQDEPAADPADDEAEIVKTLEAVLAGADPAIACGDSVTERFLRRSYGDAAGCEAAQSSAKPASDAGVTQVVIHPDSVAQALARPKGGIYNGQKLRAELVLDEDAWKLDSLRSNVPVGP